MFAIDFIKMFFKPNWKIAVRRIRNDETINKISESYEYSVFEPENKYWCADPFLFEKDNKIYVFCECYIKEKHKGAIGVAEYKYNKLYNLKVIIEQKYHMSYPCVFENNNCLYMIPETCDNNTIELYRAINFPYEWVLDTTLKKDIKYMDATVFMKENKLYLLAYEGRGKNSKLIIFYIDMYEKALKSYAKIDGDNIKRPAGNIFNIDNETIRPSQDCRKKYGGQIIMNEIISFNKDNYQEKMIGVCRCENIKFEGNYKADRIHTINKMGDVEVIDFSQDKFDLFRTVKVVKARVVKHKY